MPLLEVSLNIYALAALFGSGLAVGIVLAVARVRVLKRRVNELEKEMLHNHEEILQLHREKVQLLEKMQETTSGQPSPHTVTRDFKREVTPPVQS